MLAKGSPRQKDYVVVGGQKVYLNFIHAKRQNRSNFPVPHSLANPFVKESSLVGPARSGAPASTAAAKRSPYGSRRRAADEDDAAIAVAEAPPVILELRNQIIEHELGRRGDDDADDCEFSIEEFTPPAAAAKKRKAAEAAAAASAIKRELEAVEMKRAAATEQDKRAERETRREIQKEKIARQKTAKGKEKAQSSEEDEDEDEEGENDEEHEEEETESEPTSKRRRTAVEPARRQPDRNHTMIPAPSPAATNNKTSPTSPRGLPSSKSPFTVPTSPFAAASTRSDKRTTPVKSPRASASSAAASTLPALPSAAAATSNSTRPASTSTATSTTSACIPSSLDPMSSPSDEFEITSSFLATIDVLEKSVTGRWIEDKGEDEPSKRTNRSKTAEPKSAARTTHERKPDGDGDDCDDSEGEERLERQSARAALPAVRGGKKATTVGSGVVDREEVMDSQWIDSPFCLSTQAARAFAAAAAGPHIGRSTAKRWANGPSAASGDGEGASTWDESPASSWSPASPSSSPLQSGFSLLPPAL